VHGCLNAGYWKLFAEEHSNFRKLQKMTATVDLSLDGYVPGEAVAVCMIRLAVRNVMTSCPLCLTTNTFS
jgi:hypothetical protein